ESSQWIDQPGVDTSSSVIKSPIYSMPVLMLDLRAVSDERRIVIDFKIEDTFIHLNRLYRHVLVARAP
ncbi:MAG: hypothetical protein JXK92_01400, partial [Erysipelotrichaceae bacterium]|nr:hypothetical protein [Erysipelotrichaceae bacterium]